MLHAARGHRLASSTMRFQRSGPLVHSGALMACPPNRSAVRLCASRRSGTPPALTFASVSDDSQRSSIASMPSSIMRCKKNDCLRPVASARMRSRCSRMGSMRTATTLSLFSADLFTGSLCLCAPRAPLYVGFQAHVVRWATLQVLRFPRPVLSTTAFRATRLVGERDPADGVRTEETLGVARSDSICARSSAYADSSALSLPCSSPA